MHNVITGIGMIGATALLIYAGSARAETNIGDRLALKGQVVCDTENQIQQVADIDRETKGKGVFDLVEEFAEDSRRQGRAYLQHPAG